MGQKTFALKAKTCVCEVLSTENILIKNNKKKSFCRKNLNLDALLY